MAKKYLLVEPKLLEQMQKRSDIEKPPDPSLNIEVGLQSKLEKLLDSKPTDFVPVDEKVREIKDTLSRFLEQQNLRLARSNIEPERTMSERTLIARPSESGLTVEEIVSGAPKRSEQRVRSIAMALATAPKNVISWNKIGDTFLEGKEKLPSNILDYIFHLIKPKPGLQSPPGFDEFLLGISGLPIASAWITNPVAKERLQFFRKKDASHTSFVSTVQTPLKATSSPIASGSAITFPLKTSPIRKRKRKDSVARSPIKTRSRKAVGPWNLWK